VSKVIHLHVDPNITEEIHIVVHLTDPTELFLAGDIQDDDTSTGSSGSEVEVTSTGDDALEAIFKRFVSYDATTPARDVVDGLRAQGWIAHAPRHRPETVNRAAYVRMTYAGAKRSVTAYIQTNGIVVDRAADFELMKTQPGAVVAGRKVLVYFYDERDALDLGNALAALDVLRGVADGR
jgi:hypothetical protein